MDSVLSNLSDALAATVAKAGPGVVRVEARQHMPSSGIVWSADGVIVTAHHVVEQEDGIRIGLPDGQSIPATLVGRDPTTDIAVLQAKASGLAPQPWAQPDSLKVGHIVMALSRPGQNTCAALGVVSALGGSWVTSAGGRVDSYLHTDVVIYPGFSGGALVDVKGNIVGLNTAALRRGIPIALAAPTVLRTVEALLAKGHISRGYLGVISQPARLPQPLATQLGQETGLLIFSVAPGGPAEKGGLLMGDTIIGVDSQPIRAMDDLLVYLSSARIGARVPVRVVRGGQPREFTVVIGEHD